MEQTRLKIEWDGEHIGVSVKGSQSDVLEMMMRSFQQVPQLRELFQLIVECDKEINSELKINAGKK